MKLFEKEAGNTGRQIEADIAKAVCILGMVFVHCFEEINIGVEEAGTAQYIFVDVLDCIFGAGTFMFCMGLGIAFTRSSSPKQLMKRGGQIFLFGYLLNIVRFCLVELFMALISGDSSFYLSVFTDFFDLDIMQFAGLALLLFGFLKKIRLPDWGIAAVALVLSGIGSFVRTFDLGNFVLDQTVGLFLGTVNYELPTLAFFPLFNWFIHVAAGYLFATLLRRCTDKKRFYLTFSLPAAAVVIVYMLIAIPNKLGMMGDSLLIKYYHMTTFDAIICICGAISALGVYYAISHILPQGVQNVISGISRNINRIYCIHWVLLCWILYPLIYVAEVGPQSDLLIFGFGTALFIVSVLLASVYTKFKDRKRHQKIESETKS